MPRTTHTLLLCFVAVLLTGLAAGCSKNPTEPAPGGVVRIRLEPYTLQADWSVTGPGDFRAHGTGDLRITGRPGGTYSVTWSELPGWISPPDEILTMAEGDSAVFIGGYASAAWDRQETPTTETLMGISFANTDVGAAVGTSGTILWTIDGGDNWVAQDSGTDHHLYAVDLADSVTGTAVGKNGTLLNTVDGGATWVPRDAVTSHDLTDVEMVNALVGTVVGKHGVIRRTTDNGDTWTPMHAIADWDWSWQDGWIVTYYPRIDDEVYGISYSTPQAVMVVGEQGLVLRSSNSGTTWNPDSTVVSYESLADVAFLDRDQSFAVGFNGTIIRSIDRGLSWESLDSGTDQYLYALDFADFETGYVVGLGGTILHTVDGGTTWTSQIAGTFRFLMDVEVIDADTAVAVGEDGIIIRTTVGGG